MERHGRLVGDANPFVDIAIASGLDHVRNSVVAHADAVIAIGGGAGTMSEICFAWIYKRLVIGGWRAGVGVSLTRRSMIACGIRSRRTTGYSA
jgi:uncharacterized protein (TIGR00725 family)